MAVTNPKVHGNFPVIGVKYHKVFGLPVDQDIIFSNSRNKYKPRIEKRQRKLIIKIPFIRPFLDPDENILLVTTGHSPPTVFEKLGIGWFFIYLKRSLLIFTDRRIFHVPTTSKYTYRNCIAQIYYAFCESIQVKGRSLVVNYNGGEKTEKFVSLSGREKKKIGALLKIVSFADKQAGAARRVHLCPQCATGLNDEISDCRKCGLKFKSSTVATLLAILFPGGGYFYLRQPFLGMINALLEMCAAIMIGLPVNDLINGVPSNLLWLGGGTLLLCLLKAFAVVHARVIVNEFIPRKKTINFQTATAMTR